MHVLATAGHVDHGKSTLVRALTGMEPDRWAEERRRGMTIDLGFAWTTLPDGEVVAFVDVPGHERFVPNMLAGVGPVPAVVVVVAADEGWRQQSAEHLRALDALAVRHGLLVVTRSDRADPAAATDQARREIGHSSLGAVEAVAVSGTTGAGLGELRAALSRLVAQLPAPDLADDVRLWVDRSFTVPGAGTVVTATLARGSLRVGDTLTIGPGGREVRVRGLHSLGRPCESAAAVARVAVNLRGVDHDDVRRGDALTTPGAWLATSEVDVRVRPDGALHGVAPGTHLVLHVGTAAVPARVRRLGADTARLRLAAPLPLRIGDRAVLREPSNHEQTLGVQVLDPRPPALTRRGDAARRAAALAALDGTPDASAEVSRRGLVTTDQLRRLGVRGDLPAPLADGWLVDPALRADLARQLHLLVDEHRRSHPLEHGIAVGAAARCLGLPSTALLSALAPADLVVHEGRVLAATAARALPAPVQRAVDEVRDGLAGHPFAAPEAHRLHELGLGRRELAAAAAAGLLMVIGDGIVLLPDAAERAATALVALGGPFTVSDARRAWGTSRRVALPLLELLDRSGVTTRLPDGGRRLADQRPAP
ncbi:MAG: selenocysteine-specific elongation factor [Actinomycetota bacterium]|nr:selenocysteine-specific elongation factor [Actinomycetota bacterium]